MSLADEMAFGLRALIAEQGGPVVLRNKTKLNGPNPGMNPPTYDSLVIQGTVAGGAGSVVMAGSPFTGRFVSGDQFTIAGNTTVYTVNADCLSPTTADTVTVTFTPVLAAQAADGAVVTVTKFAADTTLNAVATDFPGRLIDGTSIQAKDQKVRFLASDLPNGVLPSIGDMMLLANGTDPTTIIFPDGMSTHGVTYGWACQVRR